MSALLEVQSLNVDLPLPAGMLHAVRDVSFSVATGETLSLVAESGCGKSMTALAIMNLLPPGAIRQAETLRFENRSLMDAADIFQRILSANPEDFLAHVGQAIIYKEDALYNQAIWHMERAFEVDPYNPAIRDELIDLHLLRDETVPEKLDLNAT